MGQTGKQIAWPRSISASSSSTLIFACLVAAFEVSIVEDLPRRCSLRCFDSIELSKSSRLPDLANLTFDHFNRFGGDRAAFSESPRATSAKQRPFNGGPSRVTGRFCG